MKKILSIVLTACLLVSLCLALTACGHECEFATTWSKDATDHWHACTGCDEKLDKADHTFGAATKVKNGVYNYACTACGEIKTETMTTKITAEQLTDMALGENFVITINAVHESMGSLLWIEMRDGNKFMSDETMTNPDRTVDTYKGFVTIEGEEVYGYYVEYDNNDQVVSCIKQKRDMTPAEYIEAEEKEFLPNMLRNLSAYTYDEQTNTYTSAAIDNLSNIKIAFENGKIVSLSYTETMGDSSTATYEITFVYGTASVTVPEVTPAT